VIRSLLYELRYLLGKTPWDTGISPPELIEYLENHSPGRALDLGCGTGTNALTISKYGWEVIGVDASYLAIRRAQAKVRQQDIRVVFERLDVSRLKGIRGKFDLILDIGCFHALSPKARMRYIQRIAQLIGSGGAYLLYTWLADPNDSRSPLPDADGIKRSFSPYFALITPQFGTERGQTSAWYQIQANGL